MHLLVQANILKNKEKGNLRKEADWLWLIPLELTFGLILFASLHSGSSAFFTSTETGLHMVREASNLHYNSRCVGILLLEFIWIMAYNIPDKDQTEIQ